MLGACSFSRALKFDLPMQRTLLFAKIHDCTLTGANLDYVGSIGVDRALLDAAGILPYEQVQVVNANNGARLVTYTIAAPAGSGAIELNGAAARLGAVGDRLIVMAYGLFQPEELTDFAPTVAFVDGRNRLLRVERDEAALLESQGVWA